MVKIMGEEKARLQRGIAIPPPAKMRGNAYPPRRQTRRITPSIAGSRKHGSHRSADMSFSSANGSYSSASDKSITSSKSLPQDHSPTTPLPQNIIPLTLGNRKESETLVQEAFIRGEPVTLFNSLLPSDLLPPSVPQYLPLPIPSKADETPYPPRTLDPGPSADRDADTISLRSVMTLDQKYPFTPHRHRSRDITPTPTDPFGLRKDPKTTSPSSPLASLGFSGPMMKPSATQVVTPSPRKKAALYDSPRWPRGGRPSPSSPTSLVATERSGTGSKEGKRTADTMEAGDREAREVDPAEAIWKGIDEEYASPEGGRFKLRRMLRRKASVRTEFGE